MLVIRRGQVDALRQGALATFIGRMVAYFSRMFPRECAALGAVETEAAIRDGIQRAARYQIECEYDICLFLHLIFALGRGFDDDPKHAPFRALLEDKALMPSTRISLLHDQIFTPQPNEGCAWEGEDE